jgi:hypothetical protein
MKIFDRLSNGWKLGKMSLETIKDNPSLMLFPVVSGAALTLIVLSFLGGGYFLFADNIRAGVDIEVTTEGTMDIVMYLAAFLFYLINYFIIVFFNVGLVYCARLILEGEKTSFSEGISYAMTRTQTILAWAALAATVGMILKTIQERAGGFGKILSGIIGIVWSIATFFVVPIIAYEDVSPIEAVKRSGQIMKDKWGESIGSNFSFGIFTLLGIILVALPLGFLVGAIIHPAAGVAVGILGFLLVNVAVSAGKMVFLTAVYQHVNGEPIGRFEEDTLDGIFIRK